MIVYDSKNEQKALVILAPSNVNLASKLADLGLLETAQTLESVKSILEQV